MDCEDKNKVKYEDLVGGHVDYDNSVYLTPICKKCNNPDNNKTKKF